MIQSSQLPDERTVERLERVALLPLLFVTVLLVGFAVRNTELLHLSVAFTPATFLAAVGAIALGVLILRFGEFALVLLASAVYLNLSNVLVRAGFPSLLQIAAIPLLLAALVSRRPIEWMRLTRQPLTWLLVAYTLVVLGSTLYAQSPALADESLAETAKALIIYMLVVLLASSERRIRLATWTMVLVGAALSLLAILRLLGIAIPGLSDAFARFELAHIHATVFEPRITGPLGDANFFAQILLVLVPIGLFLAWQSQHRAGRLLAYTSVGLLIGATALTYSRGGALALGCVVLLTFMASGIGWRRLALGAALVGGLAAIIKPLDFAARLATVRELLPGSEEVLRRDSSFEERRLLTGTAWQMFLDNPALGIGAGNYTERFAEYSARLNSSAPDYHDPSAPRYPHNLALQVGAETGMLGLSIFAAALLASFTALRRVRRLVPSLGMRGLARALQIAIGGYLISSLFLHGDFQRYLWLLLGMAGAMDALAPARRWRRPRDGTPSAPLQPATGPAGAPPPQPNGRPAVRRGIAVLLSRFPSVTETFILREVIEMERQGQPVRLVPLLREYPPVVHREAQPWIERALYTPFVSLPIVAANTRMFLRHPVRYLTTIARLALGSLRSPRVFAGTISIIPKSFYLAERMRAEGIKHVHAHFATHPTTAAFIIAKFAGASFSFTIHAHDLFSRKYRPLLRMKLDHAAFVRVISRYNKERLRELYPDAPLDKVHVIHVGIEPELYDANAATPVVTTNGNGDAAPAETKLLSVAALRDYKGIPVLLDACRRLLDDGLSLQCNIVGEGPMRPLLESRIRELGLHDNVRLVGARPQHEVRRLLAARPIFVLSSVILPDGWMEGIPVALMEAMASRAVVVTSRISGIPELVQDGVSGVLVEQGDPVALADAIRRVALAPDAAARLGEAGRSRVEAQFRLDSTVSQLLTLVDVHNESVQPAIVNAAARLLNGKFLRLPVGVRSVYEGSDAIVAELVVPDERGSVHPCVVRTHRDHPNASAPATTRAYNEATVLTDLLPGVGSSNATDGAARRQLGVPRLIRTDGDTLLMERCDGTALSVLVRGARFSRHAAQWRSTLTAIRQTGEWLRGFQRQSSPDPDAALAAWHLALAGDLSRCTPLVRHSVLWNAQQRLTALLHLSAESQTGVRYHGDFGPGNVFVSDHSIQVIDFEGTRPGLPYEDVAYFVMQLELFLMYPFLDARRGEAVAAFLDGYLSGEPLDVDAYRTARLSKALQLLARTPSPSKGRFNLVRRKRQAALSRILQESLQ